MFSKYHYLPVICLFFLGFSQSSLSQYALNGDAIQLPEADCFQTSIAINNQRASIWNTTQIDLTQAFDIEFTLNFGVDDINGADGFIFVLQNDPAGTTALGQIAENLGFNYGNGTGGLSPSLGVEFDTWSSASNLNDPSYDHTAISINGNVDHNSADQLVGPLPMLPLPGGGEGNVEDGQDYEIRVQWDPITQTIDTYVNCELTISLVNYDLINNVFSGNPNVWYGITSATGGFDNIQSVCFSNNTCCLEDNAGFIVDP